MIDESTDGSLDWLGSDRTSRTVARLTRFERRGHKKFPKGPPFAYVFWKKFKKIIKGGGSIGFSLPRDLTGEGGHGPVPPPPLDAPLIQKPTSHSRSNRYKKNSVWYVLNNFQTTIEICFMIYSDEIRIRMWNKQKELCIQIWYSTVAYWKYKRYIELPFWSE